MFFHVRDLISDLLGFSQNHGIGVAHDTNILTNVDSNDLVAAGLDVSGGGDIGNSWNSLDLLPLDLSWFDQFKRDGVHFRTELLNLVTVRLILITSPLDPLLVVEENGHFMRGDPVGGSSVHAKFEAADQAHERFDPAEFQVFQPLPEANDLQNKPDHVGGLHVDGDVARNDVFWPLAFVQERLERDIVEANATLNAA